MRLTMPKRKPTDERRASAPSPSSGDDAKTPAITPISYRPSAEVATAFAAYRSRFEYKPDKSRVIERAMRQFLRSQGFDIPELPDED